MISFSAFWCPVAVLGCAAMISWTLAARLIPWHPCDSGSSGISWRIYFRSCVHSLIHNDDDDSSSFLPLTVVGGRTPRKKVIAMIPKIPQYPGLYVSLP